MAIEACDVIIAGIIIDLGIYSPSKLVLAINSLYLTLLMSFKTEDGAVLYLIYSIPSSIIWLSRISCSIAILAASLESTNKKLFKLIQSLREIIDYKSRVTKKYPYYDLLKGKDNSKFKFGATKLLPVQSDYKNLDDLSDWESRIRKIVETELVHGHTYDLGVLGHDNLNQRYITYGKHFLINSESDIESVIIKIQGNIDVTGISLNSGEIGVAENNEQIELGFRIVVFAIRQVSFDVDIKNATNKVLREESINKAKFLNNQNELLRLKNKKMKALFNSLPISNNMTDFGRLINKDLVKSGVTGSLYEYKPNLNILIHNTNIKKAFGYEGIVFKNDREYCRFTDKTIGEQTFFRSIDNTTIKYVNKKIEYMDSKIKSLKV